MQYNAQVRLTQRSEGNRQSSSFGNEKYSLNASTFGVSFILLSAFVVIIALLVNNNLPPPVGSQEGPVQNYRFLAENAFSILQNLSAIGPKITGTYENEQLAVEFIKEQIRKVINMANKSNVVQYDVQVVSDCYHQTGLYKCYQNIQNIVVKLTSKNASNECIMLNSHFDSVPSSPGASDDGVNCVVMLEILRGLAMSEILLQKCVIFLFNGAEEDGLLGSHGFITQHRWAKNISTFINLDACGAGGQEILFQTGPNASVLPQIYARSVPYPYGSVIAEELFQSGFLPSDTDFRNFRDFGHLKGLDLAHFRNGYVYHTSSDNISYVSKSAIQHTGDNVLALLRALIEDNNLEKNINSSESQAVFFDVFGYFMICYSEKTALIINVIVVLLSAATSTYVVLKIFKEEKFKILLIHFSVNFYVLVVSLLAAALVLHSMSALLKWKGLTMLWYSNQWFLLAYYCLAAMLTFVTILRIRRDFIYSSLNAEYETQLFIIITQAVCTLFVFLCTLLQIRSIYLLTIGLFFLSISHVAVNIILQNTTIGVKVVAYVVCNFFPFMYLSYLLVQFVQFLVPIFGRISEEVDSEILIWILCEVVTFLNFMYFIPLVILVKQWWKMEFYVILCYAIFIIVVLFGSVLSPFENETPERFDVLHVHRIIANPDNSSKTENSGYLLVPLDKQASQTVSLLFGDMNFSRVNKFCEEDLLCALPLTKNGYRHENYKNSYWTEAEKAYIPDLRELKHNTIMEENSKLFNITLSGVTFAHIFIWPMNNAELIECSFDSNKPKGATTWKNQTVFIIRYVRGLSNTREWSFWLKFNTSYVTSDFPVFKLAWSSEYRTTATSHFTNGFQTLISRFPLWTRSVFSVAVLEEYLF